MDNWRGLWQMKGRNKLPENAYEYFWGREAYEEVQNYLECLSGDLVDMKTRLDDEFQSKKRDADRRFRHRVGFVVLKKEDMRDSFNRLRQALKNLDNITRSKFWATVDVTGTDASIDNSLIVTLATLKEQTERLWITLNYIHQRMPSSRMAASTKGVPISSWRLLKGTESRPSIDLGFVKTRDDRTVLSQYRYKPGQDATELPRWQIREATDLIIRQRPTPVSVVSGSSLRGYFGRISRHPSAAQTDLRERSRLDRATVAHEVAEWAVLYWNSAWMDELCICKIYYTFAEDDSTFESPFRAIEPHYESRRSERKICRKGCLDETHANRRHLRLAVVVASLALGCQVLTVASDPGRSFRFIASINGSIQRMNERELVDLIGKDNRNHNWYSAVLGCLEMSHRGDLSEQMLPADFRRYEAWVLKP
jgi:hypothetical protein